MNESITTPRRRFVVSVVVLTTLVGPVVSTGFHAPTARALPTAPTAARGQLNTKHSSHDDSNLAKVDTSLLRALDAARSARSSAGGPIKNARVATEVDLDLTVLLADGVEDRLTDAGLIIAGTYPEWNRVSGRAPIDAVPTIAALPEVMVIHREYGAVTQVGSASSQADVSMSSDDARTTNGVDGSGITIGVLSDTLNAGHGGTVSGSGCGRSVTGMDNQTSGDLPASMTLLSEPVGGSDEGAGMAELIHDIAPSADLMFASAFQGGQAGFASAITSLRDCGADVIVDDVIYLAEPMFQDGPIARAAQDAVDSGVAYFSSAGNQGTLGVDEFYSGLVVGAREVHDFGGDGLAALTVPSGAGTTMVLQWNEPYADGLHGATIDYDISVYADAGRSVLLGSGTNAQGCSTTPGLVEGTVAGDPVEVVDQFVNSTGSTQTVYVEVERFCGTPAAGAGDRFRIATYTSANAVGEAGIFDQAQQYGHAAAEGVVSVAAMYFCEIDTGGLRQDSPTTFDVESFSSLGGDIPIYFDRTGNPIVGGPITRPKPEITAPDGTNTTSFGSSFFDSCDSDGLPNFFGTSAAAPHAAAVAALMLDRKPGLTPAEITTTMMGTAVDAETPGYDFLSGAGFIDAAAAVAAVVPETRPGVTIGPGTTPTNSQPITFTATFGRPVNGLDIGDIIIGGTAGATSASTVTGSGADYQITVTTATNSGTVTARIPAAATTAVDSSEDNSESNTATIVYDVDAPVATVNLATGQSAATNTATVKFSIRFDEPVTGFDAADLSITGTAGASTGTVTGGPANYTATVTSIPKDGTVALGVASGAASDAVGNLSTTSVTANTVTIDRVGPVATVNRAAGQGSTANSGPVRFSVVFDQPVTGFTTADLTIGGTAGASGPTIAGGPTAYTVDITNIPRSGTVTLGVRAGAVTDGVGNPSTVVITANTATVTLPTPPAPPAVFASISPVRLVETRSGVQFQTIDDLFEGDGPIAADTTYHVKIAGRGGIPADATAAVLNLTTVGPKAPGFLTIYPCGTQPLASGINFATGAVLNNEVVAKLSPTGHLCIYASAETHLVIDAVGSTPNTSPFVAVTPARIVETRAGTGNITVDHLFEGDGPVATNTTYLVKIAGRGGIAPDATAAVLNLTAVGSSGPGFLTIYPCGTRPLASGINFAAGAVVNNEIITKLSTSGEICIYASARTHLVIDVSGYIPPGAGYAALTPARIVEIRTGTDKLTVDHLFEGDGPIATNTTYRVQIAGRGGIAPNATAAVLNLTTVGPVAPGFLTIYPCDTQPLASGINYTTGAVVNNEIITKLSNTGEICIYASAQTHLVIDATGWL